ncbi:tRNA pseudouridine synthase A [Thermacetogenium phaeum DSM 12270]|uniref:tRNA pseudouridine synthase A n=1 Tax=Thermacetogenium phaeum (strain ATCC BAA-254 / DSM 26808 / PB) TaxID=1089553 RepID=K4LXM1_THEPS|nr:tRNA pseudouridine(38-40) synthase TruA [Thermacetogenium phaeum]AFV12729.1 tRNA pseudouridine synthase A [Thermacetogenium phaeum DSM 12270]
MRRVRLCLEYDGTNFAGFQKQTGTGLRTVQGVLEEALARLTGEGIKIVGAGRTDKGVHALGQVVHFDTCSSIPVERFPAALNGLLPPDLVVLSAALADTSFHARYGAVGKRYSYLILNSRRPTALWRSRCYQYPYSLDLTAMRLAVQFFHGEHDFQGFSATGSSAQSTVRRIFSFDIDEQGDWICFSVTADGFLYKMVRLMVGTLLEVGRGKMRPQQVKEILDRGERGEGGPALPPQGLYLVKVYYPGEEKGMFLDRVWPIS